MNIDEWSRESPRWHRYHLTRADALSVAQLGIRTGGTVTIGWVPTDTGVVDDVDESNRRLRYRARGDVSFGDIPDGWSIQVVRARGTTRIGASSVGESVDLSVDSLHASGPLTIDAFERIAFNGATANLSTVVGADVHLMSTCDLTATGATRFTSDYQVTVLSTPDDSELRAQAVIYSNRATRQEIVAEQTVRVNGAVVDSRVEAGGSVEVGSLASSSVTSDDVVHIRGAATASSIRARRQIVCQSAHGIDAKVTAPVGQWAFIATSAPPPDLRSEPTPETALSSLSGYRSHLGDVADATITIEGASSMLVRDFEGSLDAADSLVVITRDADGGTARTLTTGGLAVSELAGFTRIEADEVVVAHRIRNVREMAVSGAVSSPRLEAIGNLLCAELKADEIRAVKASASRGTVEKSDAESRLELGGGVLAGPHMGAVVWRGNDQLDLGSGTVAQLGVDMTGSQAAKAAELDLKSSNVATLQLVNGAVVLTSDVPQSTIRNAALAPGTALVLNKGIKFTQELHFGHGARLTVNAGNTVVHSLDGSGQLLLKLDSQLDIESSKVPVDIEARGAGLLTLTGRVGRLATTTEATKLDLNERGEVLMLEGPWSLNRLDGRCNSAGAPIAAFEAGSGQLTGIDPTGLPYDHLPRLRELHVFDPDAKSLKRFAKTHRGSVFDRKSAAEHANRIAGTVGPRAVSGSSRTAAGWAAHRLQHSTTKRVEWALRWLHRLVGYSQRPLPALLTWLSITALIAGGDAIRRLGTEAFAINIGELAGRFLFVLVLPFGLLRFRESSSDDLVLFESVTAHSLALVAMGLPFLFLVIALRQYLGVSRAFDGP